MWSCTHLSWISEAWLLWCWRRNYVIDIKYGKIKFGNEHSSPWRSVCFLWEGHGGPQDSSDHQHYTGRCPGLAWPLVSQSSNHILLSVSGVQDQVCGGHCQDVTGESYATTNLSGTQKIFTLWSNNPNVSDNESETEIVIDWKTINSEIFS